MGATQWSEFYVKYVVLGSRITVRAQAANNSSTGLVWGVITSPLPSLVSTTATVLQEQGIGQWRVAQALSNGAPTSINSCFSAKKLFNVRNVLDVAEIGANFTENPVLQGYFHIWAANLQDGTTPATMAFSVMIEYVVMLQDPTQLDGS